MNPTTSERYTDAELANLRSFSELVPSAPTYRLVAEVQVSRALVNDALVTLRAMEWGGDPRYSDPCCICGNGEGDGHTHDCIVGRIIARLAALVEPVAPLTHEGEGEEVLRGR